ncbi:MAG TPA: EAL domain-containing response regulator [Iamia sp.]|jgi:EAL domain-containing protein (putative c-di-GMP-specific phosphodiesterase class I)|nr:EAL domain-containing response regulator [Iamia sp.]
MRPAEVMGDEPQTATDGDPAMAGAIVLVVDDHAPNCMLLERILTKAGVAEVHSTGDPFRVIPMVEELHPHLVLLDLHMPGMDGIAVMEALAEATPPDEYLPVIVLTADATAAARHRVLEAGATDFLTKPVERTEVVFRVRNHLHTRVLHARLHARNQELASEVEAHRRMDDRARTLLAAKERRVQELIESGPPPMVFQPISELATGTIAGYEALARFTTEPRRSPDQWFAEAAEVGRGVELELAAVREALAHARRLPADAIVSVNVSPVAACSPDLPALLDTRGGRGLVLEITEHERVDDYHQLLAALGRLRETGVRLAVDDAGAGFASLQHILTLRPDVIKLDIALTRDIDRDPIKRALASSLVAFSGEIGSRLVAEGIETEAERAVLVDLGVPWGQGFHLGRPCSVEEIVGSTLS